MKIGVIAPYRSSKYDIEKALVESGVEYDEIVYVYDMWIDLSWNEIQERAKKMVEMAIEEYGWDRVYIVGAGYIPCVLAIWNAVVVLNWNEFKEIILLDYDTPRRRYRQRCIKGGDMCE